MHEIAFQADKRLAERSLCTDCSPLSLFFHEGILFVITFTRRIYSTSSRAFLPDSSVLLFAEGGGLSSSAVIFVPSCLPPFGLLSLQIRRCGIGQNMSCHAVT